MNHLQTEKNENPSVKYIPLGCLLLISLIEGVTILFGELFSVPMQYCFAMLINMSGAMFLGTVLTRPFPNKTARRLFFLGAGFCLCMGLIQLYDFHAYWLNDGYHPRYGRSTFFCDYLMLLPLAAMLDQKQRDWGMILHAGCYLAAIFGYGILTAVIYLGGGGSIRRFVSLWYQARLSVVWNPNLLGGILLVGLGMALILLFKVKHMGIKILLGGFALVDYLMLILTNSRTNLIMASCILGGLVFFLIWNGSTGRFFLGFVAAVLTLCLTYTASTELFSMRINYMLSNISGAEVGEFISQDVPQEMLQEIEANEERSEAEKAAAAQTMSAVVGRESKEGSADDYRTFNGRTNIWKGGLKALKEEPMVLLVGTPNVGKFITAHNPELAYAHAHNAWLQILIGSGVLGFAFSLIITWLAVKNCFLLFFMKQSTMDQKLVGITIMAILGAQFFEPYIFSVQYPCIFFQIPFMLCLGYAIYWVQTLPKREKFKKAEPSAS